MRKEKMLFLVDSDRSTLEFAVRNLSVRKIVVCGKPEIERMLGEPEHPQKERRPSIDEMWVPSGPSHYR